MKDNFRRLQLISKILPVENFYIISITEYDIKMQGFYNEPLLSKILSLRFKLNKDLSSGDFKTYKRDNLIITFDNSK